MKQEKEKKPGKFNRKKNSGEMTRLETYLLAADDPVGKKQLRPIFRRKRSGEVLTREQVSAIKKGRRLLRKEMKEQGLKRRIDFEVTATNLGLYFDKHRLFWPFFLWLIRDHTVAKVLATTAVLTTTVTVTVPVIQYIEKVVYRDRPVTVTVTVTETVPRIVPEGFEPRDAYDGFSVEIAKEAQAAGLHIGSTMGDIEAGKEKLEEYEELIGDKDTPAYVIEDKLDALDRHLIYFIGADAVRNVSNISIVDIPEDIWEHSGGQHHAPGKYFAYTFYNRYHNNTKDAPSISYDWELVLIDEEPENKHPSDAVWFMVFEDQVDDKGNLVNPGERNMTFYAKASAKGGPEEIPEVSETYTHGYDHAPLMNLAKDPDGQYKVVGETKYHTFYGVIPRIFDGTTIAAGSQEDMAPGAIFKYTVVMWLEGDDPECKNSLMGSSISADFRINVRADSLTEIPDTPEPSETSTPTA